ncbi:MAG: hypothetical protein IT522_13420 [Burkholderiales bacterium]|nr:hypothetical protein [Burkholderiales bacterium]
MNRFLVALAAGAVLASGSALACNDLKFSGGDDGGVVAAQAPTTPVAAKEKAAPEVPLVVTRKQPVAKQVATTGKPLPQGAVVARTGN